jgi:Uma2 family endonuclease
MNVTIEHGPNLEADVVRLALPRMAAEEFFAFCQQAADLRVERNADGEITIMPPTGSDTGHRSGEIFRQMANWNVERAEPGVAFDSSAGFALPNTAIRSPDASWVEKARWDALTEEQRTKFAPLCPDFVVELLSPTYRRADAETKMAEYIANGARLGWLIDRAARQVLVYRPDQAVQTLEAPVTVSAEPEMPGFVLDLRRIF